MTSRKVVLTAWELMFVRSVSLRSSSGFLECRNLTKRKHGALLSHSSGYPCKETKYMMKHSVQQIQFHSWVKRQISVLIPLYIVFFLQQLILVSTKHDMVRMLVLIISSSRHERRHERRPICRGKRMLAA